VPQDLFRRCRVLDDAGVQYQAAYAPHPESKIVIPKVLAITRDRRGIRTIADIVIPTHANERNLLGNPGEVRLELLYLSAVTRVGGNRAGEVSTDNHKSWLETIDVLHGAADQRHFLFKSLVAGGHAVLGIGELKEEKRFAPFSFSCVVEPLEFPILGAGESVRRAIDGFNRAGYLVQRGNDPDDGEDGAHGGCSKSKRKTDVGCEDDATPRSRLRDHPFSLLHGQVRAIRVGTSLPPCMILGSHLKPVASGFFSPGVLVTSGSEAVCLDPGNQFGTGEFPAAEGCSAVMAWLSAPSRLRCGSGCCHTLRASLYIDGVWIRQTKELHMKRLLLLGIVGCGGGEAPQQTDGSSAVAPSNAPKADVPAPDGKRLHITLTGHDSYVTSVAFSPDGQRIVSGSADKTVKIWDANSGEELQTLTGHDDDGWSVAFSPDGQRLVSGSADYSAKIWDANTGEKLRTLTGHAGVVTSVVFSPDGQRIVSGSADKTVKIWIANSGKELHTLTGHDDEVRSVSFSPDGQRIVSGSDDKTVMIWDASEQTE